MNLYELSSDLVTLSQMEDVEEVEQIKAIVEAEIESKSAGIVTVVRNLETTVDAIENEIKRLQDLKKIKKNNIDRLKEYTKECVELRGVKKVETPLGNLSLRKLPGSVEVIDETKLMNEPIYVVEKVAKTLDKKAILADLKEGLLVDGAILKTGTSLTIK